MNRVGRVLLAAALCGQAALTTAAHATTYLFSGHGSPANSGAGSILNYIDRHAPLTFEFTTAAPLAANMAFTNIIPLTTFWQAAGGSAESTINFNDSDLSLARLTVSTDATGNVARHNIEVYGTNALLPNNRWLYQYGNYDPNNVFEHVELLTWHQNSAMRYTTLGSALDCTNRCGAPATPGGFRVEQDAAPAVPEPATWATMVAGFALASAALRRRGAEPRFA